MERRTKEEWEKLVREYRDSGKSLKVWCDENGVNHHTMSSYTTLIPRFHAQRSNQEWMSLILEQKASGISREQWCRENDVKSSAMHSAEKRLREKLGAANMREQKKIGESDKPDSTQNAMHQKENAEWIEIGIAGEIKPDPVLMVDVAEPEANTISKIKIRCGKLEIEADADYPSGHLENLIGKLAAVC